MSPLTILPGLEEWRRWLLPPPPRHVQVKWPGHTPCLSVLSSFQSFPERSWPLTNGWLLSHAALKGYRSFPGHSPESLSSFPQGWGQVPSVWCMPEAVRSSFDSAACSTRHPSCLRSYHWFHQTSVLTQTERVQHHHIVSVEECGPIDRPGVQSSDGLTFPRLTAVLIGVTLPSHPRMSLVTSSVSLPFGHAARTSSTFCWYTVMSSDARLKVGTNNASWFLTPTLGSLVDAVDCAISPDAAPFQRWVGRPRYQCKWSNW